METKRFNLCAVLTITTGKLLCPMDDVYTVLNYMTGDNLYTHQLPRAMRECAPHLKAQFPILSAETGEGITAENYKYWLEQAVIKYGEWFDVAPVPEHAHEFIDPLSELAEKVHPDKIVVVTTAHKGE